MKQKVAEEVASMLKLSVDIDTTSSERLAHFYNQDWVLAHLWILFSYDEIFIIRNDESNYSC